MRRKTGLSWEWDRLANANGCDEKSFDYPRLRDIIRHSYERSYVFTFSEHSTYANITLSFFPMKMVKMVNLVYSCILMSNYIYFCNRYSCISCILNSPSSKVSASLVEFRRLPVPHSSSFFSSNLTCVLHSGSSWLKRLPRQA